MAILSNHEAPHGGWSDAFMLRQDHHEATRWPFRQRLKSAEISARHFEPTLSCRAQRGIFSEELTVRLHRKIPRGARDDNLINAAIGRDRR